MAMGSEVNPDDRGGENWKATGWPSSSTWKLMKPDATPLGHGPEPSPRVSSKCGTMAESRQLASTESAGSPVFSPPASPSRSVILPRHLRSAHCRRYARRCSSRCSRVGCARTADLVGDPFHRFGRRRSPDPIDPDAPARTCRGESRLLAAVDRTNMRSATIVAVQKASRWAGDRTRVVDRRQSVWPLCEAVLVSRSHVLGANGHLARCGH